MKHVCMKCQLFFKPRKIGVYIEEGRPVGDEWKPYKLWQADLLECRGCGTQIATGFGINPVAEHYQPDYEKCKKYGGRPIAFIKDC